MQSSLKKFLTVSLIVVIAAGAAVGGWFLYRTLTGRAAVPEKTAVLSIDPATGTYDYGKTFSADLKIDTGGGTIGSVKTTIHFDKDVLEVQSLDDNGSVFKNFAGKAYDNQKGEIRIMASTTDVFGEKHSYKTKSSGSPGQMLKVNFKVKATKGTTTKVSYDKESYVNTLGNKPGDPSYNILKETKGATYTIGEGGVEGIDPPTNLQAKAADAQVKKTLNYDDGATSAPVNFNVYRKTAGASYDKIKTVSEKSYLDKDVTNGTTYSYYVTAVVGNEESNPSNIVSATPQAGGGIDPPENLKAKAGDKQVQLTWEYPQELSGIEYNVYRKSAGDYAKIKTVSEKSYLDKDVINDTTYYYYVTAVVDNKESDPSNEVSATPSGGGAEVLHADIAHNDGEGSATYGRDGKVDYFDYAFLLNVCWGKDPSKWIDPPVDYAKLDSKGNVVIGSDDKIDYAEYAYMLNVEWGKQITSDK